MAAYYNENDPYAVAWLRELIARGLIAPGDVDDRSIKDVQPEDVRGYAQCHFFAGIAGWSYALRLAGWDDDRPIWTGSCPCQPFSVSGNQRGFDDPRDLWPDFFRIIRAERPPVIMGELTAKKAGRAWFDRTYADLENENYASRGVTIPSCAVNAPNERERLYWIAVANADCPRQFQCKRIVTNERRRISYQNDCSMGDTDATRLAIRLGVTQDSCTQFKAAQRTDDTPGFWDEYEWIACHDGKWRRAKPGTPMLVAGFSGRVSLWKGLGNAINPQLAKEVIMAYMETIG